MTEAEKMMSRSKANALAEYIVNEMAKEEKFRTALECIVKNFKEGDTAFLMALGGYMGSTARYALETLQVHYDPKGVAE